MNATAIEWRYVLAPDANVHVDGKSITFINGREDEIVKLNQPSDELLGFLLALADGVDINDVPSLPDSAARFLYIIHLLKRARCIWFIAAVERVTLCKVEPADVDFEPKNVASSTKTLSRFTFLQRRDGEWVIECPGAAGRIHATGALSLIEWFDEARQGNPSHNSKENLPEWTAVFASLGFFESTYTSQHATDCFWERHDRMFHWRSRMAPNWQRVGGTFRLRGRQPAPIRATNCTGIGIELEEPSQEDCESLNHKSLSDALADRRSIRPLVSEIGRKQIESLLFFSVRDLVKRDDNDGMTRRPYPSGGAIHELEFYIICSNIDGLADGIYRYASDLHTLRQISDDASIAKKILASGFESLPPTTIPPKVIISIVSDFPLLSWKYEGIAYRITLINAGAALQTIYLVGTALGLACCAIGAINSALLETVINGDRFSKVSIVDLSVGGPI